MSILDPGSRTMRAVRKLLPVLMALTLLLGLAQGLHWFGWGAPAPVDTGSF
ncbi:hypothetical protein [Rhizosaccharibacter radicis]|uniref:Uncharacterized protein n=1 Tax=Rhizosaccharibacter radicis TaxID=2782605 RepID=A0ABT1VW80_9PROT|nr:hypothetical protein [Acetobacteraceae bacterium KSS12]